MRTYLKVAIGAGLPFGLVMAALARAAAAADGSSGTKAVVLGLAGGAVFGVAMSALLGTAQVLADRKARRTAEMQAPGVRVLSAPARTRGAPARYTETIAVELPLRDAYAHCLDAPKAFEFARVEHADADQALIELKTARSLKSWGERVTLELEEVDANTTAIEITSRSRVRFTLADYGKNAENVQCVVAWLGRTLLEETARA